MNPGPLRTVLFATDFSEPSREAKAFAVTLATSLCATLHVLHVVEPPPYDVWSAEAATLNLGVLVEGSVRAAHAKLREEVLVPANRHLDVRLVVRVGRPVREIAAYAARVGAGLIVVGSHGCTERRDLLLGGVAEGVLREAYCPVLTVPWRPAVASREPKGEETPMLQSDLA
jgi:nucleotide-binding universal stress UspA family protein